jgi:hypothetical protein
MSLGKGAGMVSQPINTGPINVGIVGTKFMGRALSNAYLERFANDLGGRAQRFRGTGSSSVMMLTWSTFARPT